MTLDQIDEIAFRRLQLKEPLSRIGDRFGVSRQRIAQILKENGWRTSSEEPFSKPCECGKAIYSRLAKKCRECRRKPKERPLCQYCGERGGYKIPACKKHEWIWRYYEAPGNEKRRAQIVEAARRKRGKKQQIS